MSLISLDLPKKDNKPDGVILAPNSPYTPSEEAKDALHLIRNAFVESDIVMRKPRREFNDMSVLVRSAIDQMAFNTYQPNNGEPAPGDPTKVWRSNAMRPIVRNKCISIAAHALALLAFPKVFAFNEQDEEQKDAGQVMRDMVDWVADRLDYPQFALRAILTALWSPASIAYVEYGEVYRDVKFEKENGKWKIEKMADEFLCGERAEMVGVDELYIENFYESEIQNQSWLIWRKVQTYDFVKEKYGHYDNFKYVKPGVQLLYNDANQLFYEVYDSSMRQNQCEEIIYWNKARDLKLIVVNGCLLTEPDEPNPRKDKNYPFIKFGFEPLDHGRCFYYKSLAFKTQQDANIINTLYPMFIDGTYLSIMPPLVNTTGQIISSDIMVPGGALTLDPSEGGVTALNVSQNLAAAIQALTQAENSIQESAPQMSFGRTREPAYTVALRQQEAQTLLGLFTTSIASFVKQFTRLVIGDNLQYLTIADASKISGDAPLVYRTFFLDSRQTEGGKKNKRIKFDGNLPSQMNDEEELNMSFDTLKQQGGQDSETELWRVNPTIFRDFKFLVKIDPSQMKPTSPDLEKTFKLEIYDRGIQNPYTDQEKLTRDFLFGAYEQTDHNPDKYMKNPNELNRLLGDGAPNPQAQPNGGQPMQPNQPGQMTNSPILGGASLPGPTQPNQIGGGRSVAPIR